MTTVRTRTRGLAAASALTLMLGLAACGGGGDDGGDGDSAPSQDPDVTFTGDPIKVMTLTAFDTDTLNVKSILDIAEGAVVDINNGGGINGHEVELITCNEGADPNKAADCARQAVDEGVAAMIGGFTANGDAIMPILEEAGIPWFAPPGISSAELSSEDSYPITSGVLGLAGLGRMAAEDGCEKIASVNYDLPSAGQISQLVDIGIASGGGTTSDLIKVPPTTTDFSTIAQETSEYDCAVVGTPPQPFLGIAASGAQLGSETRYYVVPGGLTEAVTDAGGDTIEGTVTLSNFPGSRRPDLGLRQGGRRRPRRRRERRLVRAVPAEHLGRLPHLPVAGRPERRPVSGRHQGHARRDHRGRHRRLRAAVQLRRGLPGAGAEPGLQLPGAQVHGRRRQAGAGRHRLHRHAPGARPRQLT